MLNKKKLVTAFGDGAVLIRFLGSTVCLWCGWC